MDDPLATPQRSEDGADLTGNTADDYEGISPDAQQLPGLPMMIGQDGDPLIVPIKRAKDKVFYVR